jgi:phage tail tape-measure protein
VNEKRPTTERLAEALREANAPGWMVEKAEAGVYDDFKSPLALNLHELVKDATRSGLPDIARRTKEGEFDSEAWEADAWAKSPEGQEVFREFFGRSS